MSLWGKTDTLADSPKYVTRIAYFDSATAVDDVADTISLLNSNTGFSTGDAVLYSINGGTVIGGLVDATTYYVRVVGGAIIELYDTYENAIAAPAVTGRVDLTAPGVGRQTFRRTVAANPFGDQIYNGATILFVDREESKVLENRAKGLVSPGWWAYKTYVDGGTVTRHKAELLVAMDVQAAAAGDADDDLIMPDLSLTITTQPLSVSVIEGENATFSVVAETNGTYPITYQWQESVDAGVTWVDVDGETSATLALTAVTAAMTGYQYQVVVTTDGLTETSTAATLTVTV